MNFTKEIEKHERAVELLEDMKIVRKTVKGLERSQEKFKQNFGHESDRIAEMINEEKEEYSKLETQYKNL